MRRVAIVLLALLGAARADEIGDARETMRRALAHNLMGFDHARLVVGLLVRAAADDAGEVRQIVVRTRRRGEALDRQLCFLSPADVKNTTFLSLADGEQQFLWLPELGRVRPVSRTSRSEPFLGTTFSYRDVEGWKVDDADYRALPDENVGEHPCRVVEATFRPGAGAGYARAVSWIRKSDDMPLRVFFYDGAGKQVKALFTRRVVKQAGSGAPYARSVRMDDLRTGGSTVLDITDSDFAATLDAATFTPEQLRRGLDCAP